MPQGLITWYSPRTRAPFSVGGMAELAHYVESGQIASLSCWLAAAAPTAWVSRPHSGLLRPECQAGFRSHLRSFY